MPDRSAIRIEAVPKPRGPNIHQLLASSQHLPFYTNNGTILACHRCKQSVTVRSDNFRSWLQSTCTAIGSSLDRPTSITYNNLIIGRQTIHNTHKKLYEYRGLKYCLGCGAHSGTGHRIDKLASPCQPPTKSSDWGTKCINALKDGRLPPSGPKGIKEWPL